MTFQPSSEAQQDLPPGTLIGERYRIQDVVGRGGFAVVYSATQLNLGQPVAVKVLSVPPDMAPGFKERFVRESQTAAQIQHPDVVKVMDYGLQGTIPFMVMELLRGHSLAVEIERNGPLDIRRALRLFIRCLDALQAAHDMGIVHRDLKPDNIFLTEPNSRVEALKLLDFGIALIMERHVRLTTPGEFYGTPQYLVPEYIKAKEVKPCYDVYQMGLILVESLTGQTVVNGETGMQSMMMHCRGDLDIPDTLLNSPLGPIIRKALALDPDARYTCAAELRDALEDVQEETERHFPKRRPFISADTDINDIKPQEPSNEAEPMVFRGGSAAQMSPSGGFPHLSDSEIRLRKAAARKATIDIAIPQRPSASGQLRQVSPGIEVTDDSHFKTELSKPKAIKLPEGIGALRPMKAPARANADLYTATKVDFAPASDLQAETVPVFKTIEKNKPKPKRKATVRMDGDELVGRGMTQTQQNRVPDAVADQSELLKETVDLNANEAMSRAADIAKKPKPKPEPSPKAALIPEPAPSKATEKGSSTLPLMVLLAFFVVLILSAVMVLVLMMTGVIGSGGAP